MPGFKVLTKPNLPPAALRLLTAKLEAADAFLEYGTGGSTILAATLGIPTVVSVENDLPFLKDIQTAVGKLKSRTVLHPIAIDIGPSKIWGFPDDQSRIADWPKYATEAWLYLLSKRIDPDLILIDGRFRVASFLASLLNASSGTGILVPNYVEREEAYGAMAANLAPVDCIDGMAEFRVPHAVDRARIGLQLARYATDPR